MHQHQVQILYTPNNVCIVIPPYPQKIPSKTPSGILKPTDNTEPYLYWFFFPVHTTPFHIKEVLYSFTWHKVLKVHSFCGMRQSFLPF